MSDNGTDHANCGQKNDPCGTMYYISYQKQLGGFAGSYHESMYVEGQNIKDIVGYITNSNTSITHGFHPCLPVAMTHLEIYFDQTKITKMSDWYPSICNEIHTISQLNISYTPFMFSANYDLRLHNLIIDNYQFVPNITPYGIMSMILGQPGPDITLSCFNCKFINISSNCSPTNNQVNQYVLSLNGNEGSIVPQKVSVDLGMISAWYKISDSSIASYFPLTMQFYNDIFNNITFDQYLCSSKAGFINAYVKFFKMYCCLILIHTYFVYELLLF